MKIGALYICTGKYTIFWDEFYASCEAKFMPNDERYYFVFTDGQIPTYDNPRVKVIYQEKLGWPYDTLKRFNMFMPIEKELSEMDYIFFFNANIVIVKEIGHEFLPDHDHELSVVLHPSFYNETNPDLFVSYDRNPKSHAYIPYGVGQYCVQGGLNGGTSQKYLKMIRELDRLTEDDLSRGVIALWHDESHLNKYILDKKVKIAHFICQYPEGWDLPFEMYVMTRDKNKFGGHDALREVKKKKKSPFRFLKKIFRKKKD